MLLLSFLSFVLPALSTPLVYRDTETWSITTMDVHLMGRDTGIPGNTWPDSRKFNTTLDFTLVLPTEEVACSAYWKYEQVSTETWACGESSGVTFQLSPTSTGMLNDASWTLAITRENENSVYTASEMFENNNAGSKNGYLTCVGGAPYDGIRCKLGGWAGKPGPVPLTATSQ